MKNNIPIWESQHIVEPWIMVGWYNYVTLFGKKVPEGPPPTPPEPWRDRRPARWWAVNAIRLTSRRGSTGTMEIAALPGSTLLLLCISSIYFLIYSIFISLWNSSSTFLYLSRIIALIFSASKCPENLDCSSCSLTLDCEELVMSDNFFKRLSPTFIWLLCLVWRFSFQYSSSSTSASAAHWWSTHPSPAMKALMWLKLC